MNTLKAEINHPYFSEPWFAPFTVSIENCTVSMDATETPGNVIVSISGRKGCKKLRSLFFEIYELFFIYLGHYPNIISLNRNGESEDLNVLLNKYKSSSRYGRLLAICDINEDSVNEKVLFNMRKLRSNPRFSLEYVVSQDYDNINITHRLLLLLHAMDGMVSQAQRTSIEQDLKKITGTPRKKNDKKYEKTVFFICQNSFFNYHRKYNCEILQALGQTKRTFLEKTTDTRNVYSHFYIPSPSEAPIESGAEMLYYFEILFLTARIFLSKEIGVNLKDNNIKESLYRIHDWIIGNKKRSTKKYKSWAYKLTSQPI